MVGRGREEEAGAVSVLQAMRCLCVTLGNSGEGVGSALLPTLRKWAREEEEQEHGVSGPWCPGPWKLLPVSFWN